MMSKSSIASSFSFCASFSASLASSKATLRSDNNCSLSLAACASSLFWA